MAIYNGAWSHSNSTLIVSQSVCGPLNVRVVAIAPGHFKRGEPRTRISSTFSLNVYIFTPF